MTDRTESNVFDHPDLRGRSHVFADRSVAGGVLAEMLARRWSPDALVLAVPAGGVPVGVALASQLHLPLDVAIVSKITPTWNTEVGYGAVACDGTHVMNEALIQRFGLTDQEVRAGLDRARRKVRRRIDRLRGDRPKPDVGGRCIILVDDGLATGYTLRCAIKALKQCGTAEVVLAVPTAHAESIDGLRDDVKAVYCPNIRSGWSFAVADAYAHWSEVSEHEVTQLLAEYAEKQQVAQPHAK